MDCFPFPCLRSDVRIPPRLSPWIVLLGMCRLKSCKRIENANDDETCRDVSKPKVSFGARVYGFNYFIYVEDDDDKDDKYEEDKFNGCECF